MEIQDRPIGFFDSGVGGISVLREAVKLLPNEDFIYYGDSKNAPYGTRSVEEVKELSFDAAEFLIKKNVKAIVVACNTATSAAIIELRNTYDYMPVIGIEPALKPAVKYKDNGKILIMATEMTLAEKKFSKLMHKYGEQAKIESLPCPKLVEFIEKGVTEGEELKKYLKAKLCPHIEEGVGAIVLGCTHYPFAKQEIKNIAKGIPVIDGSIGTAKQLRKELSKLKCLKEGVLKGNVSLFNSSDSEEMIELSYKLFQI